MWAWLFLPLAPQQGTMSLLCSHFSGCFSIWEAGPSKNLLRPARPAGRTKWCRSPVVQLVASPGSTASPRCASLNFHWICSHRTQVLAKSCKQVCLGPQPTTTTNLLSSSFHLFRGLQTRDNRMGVTCFFLCAWRDDFWINCYRDPC